VWIASSGSGVARKRVTLNSTNTIITCDDSNVTSMANLFFLASFLDLYYPSLIVVLSHGSVVSKVHLRMHVY